MKTKIHHPLRNPSLVAITLATASVAYASSDYGPAIWNPPSGCTKYSTSGYGHKFHVCHDMEGYYLSSVSLLRSCSTTVSVHYAVNGKQDTSTDASAGQITQMVNDANYAWHVLCWNHYCTGTEHEGFASNPAWYTDALYQASAGITKHLHAEFGWPADRNHIIGHNEWQNANWRAYAGPAFGINTTCNSHDDPGPYWDWSRYMNLVANNVVPLVGNYTGALNDTVQFAWGDWSVRFGTDGSVHTFGFGQSGDIPLLGDWTGSLRDEVLFRPSNGNWYVRFGTDGSVHNFAFGQNGDIPLMGDWTGNGMRDTAVFRPSASSWYVRFSTDASVHTIPFGEAGDIPLVGNWTGQMQDTVLFRPSNGTWYVRFGTDGSIHSFAFGQTGDIPMLGNWGTGTGLSDAVLFRPSTGMWYVRFSSDGSIHSFAFGQNGDIPLMGNWTGTGVRDTAVYRPSNDTWYVRFGTDGSVHSFQH